MPPRSGRFSKSTKATKPEPAPEGSICTTEQPTEQASAHSNKRSRACSVEVVITPSKKRRVAAVPTESSSPTQADHVDAKKLVTPAKSARQSSTHFLPTPPITPTISISDHEGAGEGEEESIALLTPSSSTSSPSCAQRQDEEASPSPFPSRINSNIYSRARSLLRLSAHGDSGASSSSPTKLIGRQAERSQLGAFLRCHFPTIYAESSEAQAAPEASEDAIKAAKAMYISGSPGTGKTALLNSMLRDFENRRSQSPLKMTFLNCASIPKSEETWRRLAEELELSAPVNTSKGKAKAQWSYETFREAMKNSSTTKSLVVLDEIDHLLPGTPAVSSSAAAAGYKVLSSLFAIALDPQSQLVLIGIANALDLTQRYQAMLSGNSDTESTTLAGEPELLHFRPFQSNEMVAIVKQRLQDLHQFSSESIVEQEKESQKEAQQILPLPVIMPAALELAAKKVAAVTGDLRSFLSLVRKAVELFETEQRKRLLTSNPETSVGPASPTKNTLAYKNRRRTTVSLTNEGREDDTTEDPLARFTALTAPKLTPAHILKATRLVSLASSSSVTSGSSTSNTAGINSSASSLCTTSASSNNLLQSKVTELNLHQRLALTTFLILLARRISSRVPTWSMLGSEDSVVNVDAEASSIPEGGAKPSELYALYKSLLEKEDLIHPVSYSEFPDLLSGLHTRGLIGLEKEVSKLSSNSSSTSTLAPPMMRRSSSTSSVSSSVSGSVPSGRVSRSPSPSSKNVSGAQAPLYLLYPFTSLQAVLTFSPSGTNTQKSVHSTSEAGTICSNLLARESKRLKRIQKMNEQIEAEKKEREFAPSAGFNGKGLDDQHASRQSYVGKKHSLDREADEENDGTCKRRNDEEEEKTADLDAKTVW